MSNSDIRSKGKWTAIPCAGCVKKFVASKWLCICGIPWLKCPLHFAIVSQCFNKNKRISHSQPSIRLQRPAVVGKLGDPFVKQRKIAISRKRVRQVQAQFVGVVRAHIPPPTRAQPVPKTGTRKRPLRERDKPGIQRDEYGPRASILRGSKIANDLLQRGLLRKELYEDRIKVLKCADEDLSNIHEFKPVPASANSAVMGSSVGSASSSAEASGNTRKRQACSEWHQYALEKFARPACMK